MSNHVICAPLISPLQALVSDNLIYAALLSHFVATPDPLVGWGGGNPLPIPHSLAPWALPQIFSSRTAPGARGYCVAEL